ncbi:MAG: hypothetical protein WB988_00595 [Candidatus Nitrosopolaris sp.]
MTTGISLSATISISSPNSLTSVVYDLRYVSSIGSHTSSSGVGTTNYDGSSNPNKEENLYNYMN